MPLFAALGQHGADRHRPEAVLDAGQHRRLVLERELGQRGVGRLRDRQLGSRHVGPRALRTRVDEHAGPEPLVRPAARALLRVADGLRRAQVDAQDRRVELDAERPQQHGQQRRPVAGVEAIELPAERHRAHRVLADEHEPLGRRPAALVGRAGREVDAVVAAGEIAADLLPLLGLHDRARVAHRRRGDERERHDGVDGAERPRQRRAQELGRASAGAAASRSRGRAARSPPT